MLLLHFRQLEIEMDLPYSRSTTGMFADTTIKRLAKVGKETNKKRALPSFVCKHRT